MGVEPPLQLLWTHKMDGSPLGRALFAGDLILQLNYLAHPLRAGAGQRHLVGQARLRQDGVCPRAVGWGAIRAGGAGPQA